MLQFRFYSEIDNIGAGLTAPILISKIINYNYERKREKYLELGPCFTYVLSYGAVDFVPYFAADCYV